MKFKMIQKQQNFLSLLGIVFILIILTSIVSSAIYIDGTTDTINVTYIDGFTSMGDIDMNNYEIINSPSLQETADYVIWTDGSMYYAKNSSGNIILSSSDAATVINGVLEDCNYQNADIYIKEGTYILTDSIRIEPRYRNNLIIRGQGKESTILKLADNINKSLIESTNTDFTIYNLELRDLKLDGNKNNNINNSGIVMRCQSCIFERISVVDCYVGIDIHFGGYMNKIVDSDIHSNSHIGIYHSVDNEISGNFISNNGIDTDSSTSAGIYGSSAWDNRIINNHFWSNVRHIKYEWTDNIVIMGNLFEHPVKEQIVGYNRARYWLIIGNRFEEGPTGGQYPAIQISNSVSRDNIVMGNVIEGDNYTYCIYEGTSAYNNSIVYNDVEYCEATIEKIHITDSNTQNYGNKGAEDQELMKLTSSNGENLVSYWSFDEKTGNIAYDSQNNNDGTIYGASRVGGKFGSALEFKGNDYVNIGNPSSLQNFPNGITISAWIFLSEVPNKWAGVVLKGDEWNEGPGLKVGYGNSVINFQIANSSEKTVISTDIETGKWYFVVGTYDKQAMKLYVNGVLKKSVDKTGDIVLNSGNWRIGHGGYTYYFNGTIDEVKIWNRSLTPEEIRAEYLLGISSHRGGGEKLDKTGGTLTGTLNTGKYLNITSTDYGICDSSMEGIIVYNSTSKHFYGCNSTHWVQLD